MSGMVGHDRARSAGFGAAVGQETDWGPSIPSPTSITGWSASVRSTATRRATPGYRRLSMHRTMVFVLTVAALVVPAPSAVAKDGLPCGVNGVKDYPGDTAPKVAIAQWMGYHADKARLPPELPVMAALVESNLTNVSFGDADEAGYFRMRKSIWNTGVYLGFPTDPPLQLQWFIDQALIVRDQRLADGRPLTEAYWGEWVADVIRPAEQYRGLYQLRLADARALLCP